MIDTLQLRITSDPGGKSQYQDFYVNGKRLADQIDAGDNLPPLGWVTGDFDRRSRRILLLEESFGYESSRLPLYICHLCADYLCGFFGAKITQDGDEIIWSDFAKAHYDYSAPDGVGVICYTQIETEKKLRFRFDAEQYRNAILEGMPSA